MGKKQKSKAQAGANDAPADNSSSISEDTLANEESIPELLDTDTDNTVNQEDKIADLEEALLRSRAELDNAFKRNISDVEKAHKYGVERLLNELLPVVDNLEHAVVHSAAFFVVNVSQHLLYNRSRHASIVLLVFVHTKTMMGQTLFAVGTDVPNLGCVRGPG